MVTLNELKRICAEREAALTDDERAERDRQHTETFERLAKQHERMLAPVYAMQQALAPIRAIEEATAPIRAVQEALSAAEVFAQTFAESPSARVMREFIDDSVLRVARASAHHLPSMDLPDFRVPDLAGLDRLTTLARDIERGVRVNPRAEPAFFLPREPPRDVDQDERFEKLSYLVVAQTAEIVRLRGEVQSVRESAASDAERERRETHARERNDAWMKWVLLIAAAALSGFAGYLIK